MTIQNITTKAGIRVWLVEERFVPLVAMRFSFEGGSAQDPADKTGLANFMSGLFDEGAGDLDSEAYQARMEELAMRMSFDAARDRFFGSFESLEENLGDASAMLKLAVNRPRFDVDAIERVRRQILSSLAAAARNPDRVVGQRWMADAFASHPYGRPTQGTPETIAAITAEDFRVFHQRLFARDTLRVVVVGSIGALETMALVDDVFGDLPAQATLEPVADAMPQPQEKLVVVDMPVPQSVARFGAPGILRKDKDFMPAFVLNHLLGGGGFSSRLMEEVREKRGLAYSVYSFLQPMERAAIFMGGVATKNEEMAQSLEVIRGELRRLSADGPSKDELEATKSHLIGAFALRFDTNSKTADQLLYFLNENLGADYVDRRNDEIAAVTLEDVKHVAKRLFDNDDLFVVVVGRPAGLKTGG